MPTTPPLCKWPWHICPMPLAKRGGDGTGQFSERAHLPGSSMVSHCRHLSGGRSWQLPRSIELLSCLGATKRSGPTPTALGSRCCAALGLASICRAASWPGRGSSEASRSLAGLFYSTDFFRFLCPRVALNDHDDDVTNGAGAPPLRRPLAGGLAGAPPLGRPLAGGLDVCARDAGPLPRRPHGDQRRRRP